MAEYIRDTDNKVVDEPEAVHETEARVGYGDPQSLLARAVWYVAGVLLAILALRFLLALLGANQANAFANFIYTISYPFVAPFVSLFNYSLRAATGHFETYTLVAMVVYFLVAWGITRLVTLNRPAARAY